jgi:hypothetical protein
VLGLVFVDELLAMAVFGVWGWQLGSPRWLLVVVLPLLAMTAWWLFASPQARFGGGLRRPVVKVSSAWPPGRCGTPATTVGRSRCWSSPSS